VSNIIKGEEKRKAFLTIFVQLQHTHTHTPYTVVIQCESIDRGVLGRSIDALHFPEKEGKKGERILSSLPRNGNVLSLSLHLSRFSVLGFAYLLA